MNVFSLSIVIFITCVFFFIIVDGKRFSELISGRDNKIAMRDMIPNKHSAMRAARRMQLRHN
jgi:hypothetical protein